MFKADLLVYIYILTQVEKPALLRVIYIPTPYLEDTVVKVLLYGYDNTNIKKIINASNQPLLLIIFFLKYYFPCNYMLSVVK